MSDIPEHILAQVRRFIAEGMPIEQIAFMTRIDPDIIEAERKKQDDAANHSQEAAEQNDLSKS
jgi:hypothetical protein